MSELLTTQIAFRVSPETAHQKKAGTLASTGFLGALLTLLIIILFLIIILTIFII